MIRAVLVDDEQPARDRLRGLLEGRVEIVGEASDGLGAIDCIDRLRPDLVFLDIQMPGLSGLDVPLRLSAPRPRIVFCTAYDEFAVAAFERHALDYLLKPVNSDRLGATIDRVAHEVREQRWRARENEEAVRTQARLMPQSRLTSRNLECFGISRPAAQIGGDYFDFFPLDARRTALVVGDISGKGTFAGLLAAALQARVQTLVARGTSEPSDLIREVNRLSTGTMEANRFATLVFAVFDGETRTLSCASAGHPPVLVLSSAGVARQLHATAPVIGWVEAPTVEHHVLSLTPGDVILMSTDGITETADGDEGELGADGLAQLARGCLQRPAAEIATHLLAAVEHVAGGSAPADDRTLLVAKVQ